MFRTNSSASGSSRTSIQSILGIINEEEYNIYEVNTELQDWNIPKISVNEIYKSRFSPLSFTSDYNVKTVEKVYALTKEHGKCQLFSREAVRKHKAKKYNFIHIRLVQVAVKPLTRKGIDALVLLCLREARFMDYSTNL